MDTRIIDKIRKLLALAGNNPSADEAAAAFARAQDLATRYRIELASIEAESDDPDAEMVRETIDAGSKTHPGWRKVLLAGVFHAFGVLVVLVRDGSKTAKYTIAGRRGDLDTAKYMYAAIANEIDRLAGLHAHGRGRAYSNAYRVAAASMVSKRLREQNETTIAQARSAGVSTSALTKITGALDHAESWYRSTMEKGHCIRTSGRVTSSSAAGHAAGREAGARINIGGNTAIGKGRLALGTGR